MWMVSMLDFIIIVVGENDQCMDHARNPTQNGQENIQQKSTTTATTLETHGKWRQQDGNKDTAASGHYQLGGRQMMKSVKRDDRMDGVSKHAGVLPIAPNLFHICY
jgi:hypothetical protein